MMLFVAMCTCRIGKQVVSTKFQLDSSDQFKLWTHVSYIFIKLKFQHYLPKLLSSSFFVCVCVCVCLFMVRLIMFIS